MRQMAIQGSLGQKEQKSLKFASSLAQERGARVPVTIPRLAFVFYLMSVSCKVQAVGAKVASCHLCSGHRWLFGL